MIPQLASSVGSSPLAPFALKPASHVASATRCTENAEANVRHLSPDRRQIDPDPPQPEKASDNAHVRPEEAIPRTPLEPPPIHIENDR